MKLLKLIIILCILMQVGDSQLLRSIDVYKAIVKDVCNCYQCRHVTIFHTISNTVNSQDLETLMHLKNFQLYFSELNIMTNIEDMKNISSLLERGKELKNMKKSLFVLLYDSEDIKRQFEMLTASLTDICQPIWLLFSKYDTIIDDFFENIYIPFNCKFMISKISTTDPNEEIINEIYQIHRKDELRSNVFGTWNSKCGLDPPKLSLYQRRNSLHSHLLRATIIDDWPMSRVVRGENNELKLEGVIGGIMDILQEKLNFTVKYQRATEYESFDQNNIRTGAIGTLVYNTSDIVAGILSMTRERMDLIDFIRTVYTDDYHLYIKKPKIQLSWDKYLKPFGITIWMNIVLTIFVISIMISSATLLLEKNARLNCRNIHKKLLVLMDTIFKVIGVLCNQAMEISPVASIRVLQLIIHETAYIVLAAYSAVLISSLTINYTQLPFTTLKGLLDDGSYRLGVLKGSSDYSFFKTSSNKIIKQTFENIIMKEAFLPTSSKEGVDKVCNEDKYAYVLAESSLWDFDSKNCILVPLEVLLKSSLAMGLQRYSPYKEIINREMVMLWENGSVKRILRNAMKSFAKNEDIWLAVELRDVFPLILLLFGSIIFSIILLGIELLLTTKLIQRKIGKNFGHC